MSGYKKEDPEIQIIIDITESQKVASLTVVCDEPMDEDMLIRILAQYAGDLEMGDEPLDFEECTSAVN